MLKMSSYSEKLLSGLKGLDFIPEVATSQENWIGKSEGAEIKFPIVGSENKIKVFTTRPDTIFGATYLVVAPEHDGLEGPNVLSIVGSPHRVSAEGLAQAAEVFRDRLEPLPSPRIAVLIGGRSAAFDLPPPHAEMLGRSIAQAVREAEGSVLVTFSK